MGSIAWISAGIVLVLVIFLAACLTGGTVELDNKSQKLKWWAYLHSNGSIIVKRYFDFIDIKEAQESPFCVMVKEPFEADNANEARAIANEAFTS